ncbi:Polysaccharide biosynthesis protein [Gimesia chilikensis]|uniref:Polysaccharide biosynthesis protein n=1 Tax=Gimesia chilikensis TaxID=2605989 RepID=A0A517WGQ2_9PLAN|nr:oligosaccharide flippase family protein [Gimesia chilikensis]QDU04439.1 Polysaccharide biosynthesis protein [Gimesia chilikensis]
MEDFSDQDRSEEETTEMRTDRKWLGDGIQRMVSLFIGQGQALLTANGLQALGNLSSLLVATTVAQLCGLVSVLLLTRSLGAEGYGVFVFALTIQNYLMILGMAGLRPIIVRELIRRPDALNRLWTAYVVITGGLGILLAVVAITAAAILAPTPSEQIVLTIIAIGNVAACLNPLPFYDFRHAQGRSAVIMTVCEVTALGILFAFYFNNCLSLPAAALIFAAKWIGSTAWLWFVLQRDLSELRWDWSKSEPVRLLSSSWKLIVSALLGTIPLTAGILLVRFYHGDAAAGIFGVAMYAPRALLLLVGQLNRVLQPHIMGPYGFTSAFVGRLLFVYSTFVGVIAICGAVGLLFVVSYVLPSEFRPALSSGWVMLGASALLATGALCVQYLVAMHREHFVAMINILMAMLYLTAAILLIPSYALLGAAWAMIISATIFSLISVMTAYLNANQLRKP